jgi:hypothetical protein
VCYKTKTRSKEKNAVMNPLLLGMWLVDNTSARECFSVNIFVNILNSFQCLLIEYV